MSMPSWSVGALFVRILVVGLGLALFLEQAGGRHWLGIDATGASVMATPGHWIGLLAPAFFLWALWAASEVLVRAEKGKAFGPAMVGGLRQMGGGLMLGAVCAILIQPALIFLIGNGFTEMRGVELDWSIANLVLALSGLVLVLIARQGARLKSSLEQFV